LQTVGDDRFDLAMPLQRLLQKRQGRSLVPFLGDVALKHLTFVIDCAPKVMSLSVVLSEQMHPIDG